MKKNDGMVDASTQADAERSCDIYDVSDGSLVDVRHFALAARVLDNLRESAAAREASRFLDVDNDDALSLTVGWVRDVFSEHDEAAGYDAGFDGGEFSGPAHDRLAHDEVAFLKQHYFEFSGCDFDAEVIARVGLYTAMKLGVLTMD